MLSMSAGHTTILTISSSATQELADQTLGKTAH